MLKKILSTLLALLILSLGGLGWYMFETSFTPKDFRMSSDKPNIYLYLRSLWKGQDNFNQKGLDKFNAAGSGRMNFIHFKKLVAGWPGKVHVINGRQETFYYYNDRDISRYCLKVKQGKLVTSWHRAEFENLGCTARRLFEGVPSQLSLTDIQTEDDILHQMGIQALQPLPLTWLEDWAYVEDLVKLFKSIPKEDLIYFHCDHGRGRTTTLMILLDIFHNAHDVSFDDIIIRQGIIGGVYLYDTTAWKGGTWTVDDLERRLALAQAFFEYMAAKDGYDAQTSWAQWLTQHPLKNHPQSL